MGELAGVKPFLAGHWYAMRSLKKLDYGSRMRSGTGFASFHACQRLETLRSNTRPRTTTPERGNGNEAGEMQVQEGGYCDGAELSAALLVLLIHSLQLIRNSTAPELHPAVIDAIYGLHAAAYQSCGCPGEVASKPWWVGAFLNVLPCGSIMIPLTELYEVFKQSRCGCGW